MMGLIGMGNNPMVGATVAQPLAANGWTTDSKLLGQLVDEGGISSSKLAKIAMPSKDDDARLKSLQPGASANVSIDADAHQESLAAINSWGPKPVLLSYSANGTPLAQSHTFVTRTGAGLHTPSTPALHITVAMLQTFGVFALSFILRPIGALFWGSYGDKKGRKAALAHSIMFMSGASFLIGCLPSYSVIGVGAPILLLLLRMVQGFSASGEYAGAATFLGEYAPTSKRGIYCSLIPASTAIGLLAGSTLATLMATNMNSSAMVGWGWRSGHRL